MNETEHEHDEGDEAAGAPVAVEEESEALAEEEEAEAAETPAHEPDEAPEQQATTQEAWEKRFTYAEKLFETYRRKIFDKWEEDALTLVPFNIDSGAPPGFIDTRNAGHVDEDTKAAAMEFLGFPREQDYEPDPEASQCPVCKGKGRTKLPTLVPGNDSRICPQCGGLGYQGVRSQNGHTPVVLDPAHAPAGERVEPLTSGEFDSWQQPRILPDGRPNPNHGKTPDYWIDVAPWGKTRYLTAQDVVPSV